MLFNQRVLMSNYMPLIGAGNKVILYGDYSYYWLAEREGRTLERLNELYTVTDQVGFKMTERLDGPPHPARGCEVSADEGLS